MVLEFLIVVCLLYLCIKYLLGKVEDCIEDKAIEKYNFKSQLNPYYQWLDRNNRMKEYKDLYSVLVNTANDNYPELQGRIERDGLRDFYIHHILPGKRYKRHRY